MAYGMILGQTPTSNFPVGGIILWSGSTSDIPTNWHLCDGTNGTPDLRGRFVIGAGGSYSVGNTGGESEHTLTVDEMPSHNHTTNNSLSTAGLHTHNNTFSLAQGGAHTHNITTTVNNGSTGSIQTAAGNNGSYTVSGGAHTHTFSGGIQNNGAHTHTLSIDVNNTGNSQPHNNLPPYYALCYIMKIA